jgi:hypothetical protein
MGKPAKNKVDFGAALKWPKSGNSFGRDVYYLVMARSRLDL